MSFYYKEKSSKSFICENKVKTFKRIVYILHTNLV